MSSTPLLSASFEALAASAPDAIVTIDESSTILFANDSIERVFGYAPDELIGQSLSTLIPVRLRAAHEAGMARYIRTSQRTLTWTGVALPGLRKDGSEVPLEISFGEFSGEDGRRVFSGFMRDMTEHERQRREVESARAVAEGALRELGSVGRVVDLALSSPTYEGMMQGLLHGLRQELGADEATVLLVDDATEELVVQLTDGIALSSALRVPLGRGLAGRVAASGKPLLLDDLTNEEVVHPRLKEEIKSLVAVPIRNEGQLVGVLHVGARQHRRFTDTHVRLLDIVAHRMGGVLARTRLYQAERKAREEAEQAQHSRDDVLSVVSHDLRNPVNTIAMSASLLSDPQFTLTAEQRAKQLEIIARSAQRMNRLIQDLLDVARIDQRRLRIDCRCEDMKPLASEAFEAFRELARQKSLTLACDVAPDLPRCLADRDRIIQVISNLMNNAVKFTPSGGAITMRVQRTEDGGCRFAIGDTGPGVDAEQLERIFERFWQARPTAHLGSGLGLAIAKGIVEAHHGRIWAESVRGGGSTFLFELPRADECD